MPLLRSACARARTCLRFGGVRLRSSALSPLGLGTRALLRSLVRTTRTAGRAFSSAHGSQFAAAIAYRVLLSLFPLALLVASIVGLFLQDDERRSEVAADISHRVPLLAAEREFDRRLEGGEQHRRLPDARARRARPPVEPPAQLARSWRRWARCDF